MTPRQMAQVVIDQGGDIRMGSKHVKVFARDGRLVAILPKNWGNHSERNDRGRRNVEAQLRRAGFRF